MKISMGYSKVSLHGGRAKISNLCLKDLFEFPESIPLHRLKIFKAIIVDKMLFSTKTNYKILIVGFKHLGTVLPFTHRSLLNESTLRAFLVRKDKREDLISISVVDSSTEYVKFICFELINRSCLDPKRKVKV